MNQQVNLYLSEFRPSRDWLNASHLLWLVLAGVLLMSAVSAYDYWRLNRLQSEAVELEASVEQQTRETEALERAVAERMENERLQRELENRQSQLQRTRSLLGFLEDTRLGNTQGFSSMMKDLSRASFEGLWLTEVRIEAGGDAVSLRGVARRSAMVPDFIGRLSNGESSLRERRFSRLLGTRTDESDEAGGEAAINGDRSGYQFELEAR
ncbi:MAG: PilN domain-containing protein [Pseudohongiellaceae bacterium]